MKVNLFPFTSNSGNYASQIYSGLFDLETEGKIELRITCRPSLSIREDFRFGAGRAHLVYLEIEGDQDQVIKVCYDMYDSGEIISTTAFLECDYYFKRSFFQPAIEEIEQTYRGEKIAKVLPYGLFQTGRTKNEHSNLKRTLAFLCHSDLWYKKPMRASKLIGREFLRPRDVHLIHSLPSTAPCENKILFQTRVFDPNSTSAPDKTKLANKFRVNLVQKLKNKFSDQFVGGLLPDQYALSNYPDLITKEETSKAGYFKLISRCATGIVLRGLEDSTPEKMAEYLAYARCIISEKLPYEIPVHLIEGQNIFYFESVEECVQICGEVLVNEELRDCLRINNEHYYNNYVKPSQLIWQTLCQLTI